MKILMLVKEGVSMYYDRQVDPMWIPTERLDDVPTKRNDE